MRIITLLFSAILRRTSCSLRRIYIHEIKDWPRFHWSADKIAELPRVCPSPAGPSDRTYGGAGFTLQQEAVLQTLTADVLKSSEIEGEKLDANRSVHR